eukprot:6198255-Pleurochrysis_carterae.AAC.1
MPGAKPCAPLCKRSDEEGGANCKAVCKGRIKLVGMSEEGGSALQTADTRPTAFRLSQPYNVFVSKPRFCSQAVTAAGQQERRHALAPRRMRTRQHGSEYWRRQRASK